MADALARVALAEVAATFGALLHAAGLPVAPDRSARFADVVRIARPTTQDELYWLGRVTFVQRHDDVRTYDAVFRQVFAGLVDVADERGQPGPSAPPTGARTPRPPDRPSPPGEQRGGGGGVVPSTAPTGTPHDDGRDGLLAAASDEERLRQQDVAVASEDELTAIAALVGRFAVDAPRRRGRRTVVHPTGGRADLRRTLRRAHRTGGDPVRIARRRRRDRPRRIVLLADVSGSMAPYARAHLGLLQAAVRAARAEAFVFSTRLTRVTRALATGSADTAIHRAAEGAQDWSGGTRIAAALREFNDRWGRRGMARGAVVVIVSDGWERGDPSLVGEQMARLSRLAHRVVWVNPRLRSERYEPLVGGMQAALPYVDDFLSGHSADALAQVVAAIGADGPGPRRARSVAVRAPRP